jgi:hypothetical protein
MVEEKPKYPERNLSQCQISRHKFPMERPDIEAELLR